MGAIAQWEGQIFAIAGYYEKEREWEILRAGEWELQPEGLPGVVPENWVWELYSFSTVNIKDKLYLFGGVSDVFQTSDVFIYDEMGWRYSEEKMLESRGNHRSLVNGDTIYHIGGDYLYNYVTQIEIWKMKEDGSFEKSMSNTEQDGYYRFPESFFVSDYLKC